MVAYVIKRVAYMIVVIFAVSIMSFIIIQLPPGDYVTSFIERMAMTQTSLDVTTEMVAALRRTYGLDQPWYVQYGNWVLKMLQGDFGESLDWRRPVSDLLAERVPLTILISLLGTVFVYVLAIPIGIYSATHQYSFLDYVFTVFGFIGLAIPNFILGLVVMVFFYSVFGFSVGGLFSIQYLTEPWSLAKFIDLLKHLPVPIIVLGLSGTASLIRVMRGCLLDELRKQYVTTARAKGVSERALLYKYPVRIAMSPIVSTIGWLLPGMVAGSTIVSIVLNLPTTGPLLLTALMSQDMFLAGSVVVILTVLGVIGTFISDVLLAVVDPRIRLEK